MYDKKIAMVISKDLLNWQKLNVAAFLASSVAIQFPETHGKAFITASKNFYLPFIKNPILIYNADSQNDINRAKERQLGIGIYTEPLFNAKNEEGNLIEIAKFTDDEQILVGVILYGENKKVSKALDGLKFHE